MRDDEHDVALDLNATLLFKNLDKTLSPTHQPTSISPTQSCSVNPTIREREIELQVT